MFDLSYADEECPLDQDSSFEKIPPYSDRFACSQGALTLVNASSCVLQKSLAALDACAPQYGLHTVEVFIMSWAQFVQASGRVNEGLVFLHFDGEQQSADDELLELQLKRLHKQLNTKWIPVIARGHKACKIPWEVLKNTSVLLDEGGEISDYESVVCAYMATSREVLTWTSPEEQDSAA